MRQRMQCMQLDASRR